MKSDYAIGKIDKANAAAILDRFHYLKDHQRGFRTGYNYGCFCNGELVGVLIFANICGKNVSNNMLGFTHDQEDGLFELSRLCIHPDYQAREHNLASWFVSRCIKLLRKETYVRLILSYADADYHNGTVYAACNFTYYGLTKPKTDFYEKMPDGSFFKLNRISSKGKVGEWRPRPRKHRFVMCFDKSLTIKWEPVKWVSKKENENE